MSRIIDISSGPLTAEDKRYLYDRGQHHLIAFNEEQFGPSPDLNIPQMQVVGAVDRNGQPIGSVSQLHPAPTPGLSNGEEPLARQVHSAYDEDDVNYVDSLKPKELTQALKDRDLPATGSKADKERRLLDALAAEAAAAAAEEDEESDEEEEDDSEEEDDDEEDGS